VEYTRFASLYKVTLFRFISMVFLHSSAIACSSDNNPSCAGFTIIAKNMLIQITLRRRSMVSMTNQTNRENKEKVIILLTF